MRVFVGMHSPAGLPVLIRARTIFARIPAGLGARIDAVAAWLDGSVELSEEATSIYGRWCDR